MSHPMTQGVIHIDADMLNFQKYVSTKTEKSTRTLRTAAYMWTRFLSSLILPVEPSKPAPSNFAKWNDGFGESGITLDEAKRGIGEYIKAKDSEGNGN